MATTRLFNLLEQLVPMLGVVAFIAGGLWAGILFSASWLSGRARWMADGSEIGELAMTLNRRWATPCLVVSLLCVCLWMARTRPSLGQPWMLGLGAAVMVLLFVHANVILRASRVAHGSTSASRGEGARRFMLVVSLTVLTTLVGLRFVWS